MNTQIKLILRALLPLLFIGANRIGQHIARPHFIPNGAAVRVEVLFPAFLLFFFPIILLIHGCICYINQRHKFKTSTTHYYIKPRPFVLAALNPRRQTLAACA